MPRHCPRCDLPMTAENFATFTADVCVDGCRGIWFDAGELARVDHQNKGAGPALERAIADLPAPADLDRDQLTCRDCSEPLDEIGYELWRVVLIDECPTCRGVFLDAGELAELRRRPLTEAEAESARRHRRLRRRRLQVAAEQDRHRNAASDAVFIACMM